MPINSTMTVNQILNRVAVECGLNSEDDPFASNEQFFIQLRGLLQIACEQLCLAFPWEFLTKTYQFDPSTEPVVNEGYALPADLVDIVDQTVWDLTNDIRYYGGITRPQAAAIEAVDNPATAYTYNTRGGVLHLTPGLTASNAVKYRYLSNSFALPDGESDINNAINLFTDGSDQILFDRTLVSRALKVKWLEAKGFDSSAALGELNQTFNFLIGKDNGGAILDIGRRSGGVRLIDGNNLPLTGYGS